MLTSDSPRMRPTVPMVPGRSWCRVTSMWSATGTSSQCSSRRTMRGSEAAIVPPTAVTEPDSVSSEA